MNTNALFEQEVEWIVRPREKLDLDFASGSALKWHMDKATDEARRDVVSRLFYLITAAAEDAAAIASKAQCKDLPPAEKNDAASKLRSSGEIIEIIASAIEGLSRQRY